MLSGRRFDRIFKCLRQEKRYVALILVASIVLIVTNAPTEKQKQDLRYRNAVRIATVGSTIEFPVIEAKPVLSEPEPFNATKLLQDTILELEKDGWTAPIGIGGVSRRIKALMKTPKFKAEPPVPNNLKERILLTTERWKVRHMGCFYDTPRIASVTSPSWTSQVSSAIDCISRCAKVGLSYVSIKSGTVCRCGKSASKHSISVPVQPSLCNIRCKNQSDPRPCGGQNYASVYRIAIHQRENLTLQTVYHHSSGCYVKPKTFPANVWKSSHIAKGTAAHCLVHCEKLNEARAAWDPQIEECLCGQFDSKFAENQLKFSTVQGYCDKRYCSKPENCRVRYVRIMRTYAEDGRCESRTFLPKPNGTLTALASFPGSGNTWVRHLIESATGIYSGSVYTDGQLYQEGFIGEMLSWKSRRTSVIKTHEGKVTSINLFEAAIVIVRNPYDAFVAEFNRIAGGHVGHVNPAFFRTKEWEYYVVYKIGKWLKVISTFSEIRRVHVAYFEDITMDTFQEVTRMVDFIGIPVKNMPERLSCLKSNLGGDFKRAKRKLDFDPYTSSLKKKVNMGVVEARTILKKHNLPTLPYYERL